MQTTFAPCVLRGRHARAGGQSGRVVAAQHPLAIGQPLLMQRNRAPWITGRLIGASKVVAGGQSIGVVAAQHPLAADQRALIEGDGAIHGSLVA